jgi:hypothetical protein
MSARKAVVISGPVTKSFRDVNYTVARLKDPMGDMKEMNQVYLELKDPQSLGMPEGENISGFFYVPDGYQVTFANCFDEDKDHKITLKNFCEGAVKHGIIITHSGTLADYINMALAKIGNKPR